jgi:putative flippase GtrA
VSAAADRGARAQPSRRSTLVRKLRDPSTGVLGQGVRFLITGCLVSVVYLGLTLLLADVVGLHFQLALLIGFGCGLLLHFTMQRFFVWAQEAEFALPFHHQAVRYLILAGVQYGLTAASTSLLPAALGLPTDLVYVATVGLLVSANFLVFRHGVFHAKGTGAQL